MPETFGDVFGLLEWTKKCISDPELKDKSAGGPPLEFFQNRNKVDLKLAEKFTFTYEKVKEMANVSGLLQNSDWSECFDEVKRFNTRINRTFVYLLTLEITSFDEKKRLGDKLVQHIEKDPSEFLTKVAKLLYPQSKEKNILGRLIKKSIKRTYNLIGNRFIIENKLYDEASLSSQKKLDSPLTNLSIIRSIILLRSNNENPLILGRLLYNLNQLTTNIERKNFFAKYETMLKFSLMKLLGVSLGQQITNYVDWSFPSSLFTTIKNNNNRVRYLFFIILFSLFLILLFIFSRTSSMRILR